MTEAILKEASEAFCAVVLFVMPGACLKAALKGGVITDYGVWFWFRGCLLVVRRHQKRPLFSWL